MTHLSLNQVSRVVGQTSILNDITVDLNHGEFLAVVGPSGCGKSTLLRLVAGLEELSSGDIYLEKKCINDTPPAKRNMAMVFQSYALYPHMTVFDNMAYALKLRRVPAVEIKKRVEETAKLLRLIPYLQRKPHELSGGQRQRVAMGRAIIRSPSVFLFDEPLSNLDAPLKTEMRHEIKRLHQKFKTTSMYVTHDQTEAMTMADRVLVLNQGSIEQIGTPKELYLRPSSVFVAGFTGHYPINFIPALWNSFSKKIETVGRALYNLDSLPSLKQGEELTLAIRPEHIKLLSKERDGAITLKVEFIDDMGADKLIYARCIKSGTSINFRIDADEPIASDIVFVELPVDKLHVFNKLSGKRIGA